MISSNFVGCSTGEIGGFAPEEFVHMSRRPSHEDVEVAWPLELLGPCDFEGLMRAM